MSRGGRKDGQTGSRGESVSCISLTNLFSRMPPNSLNHRIQVGGTVTGEHGVGLGKVGLLEEQFGEDGVGVMRNIKRALDPRFVQILEIILGAISKIHIGNLPTLNIQAHSQPWKSYKGCCTQIR